MTGLNISDIAAITGGEIHGGDGAAEVTSVVIDSRAVAPGALFAALPGERADGHDFITRSLDAGAVCSLARRVQEGEGRCVITVPDVADALCKLATAYRAQFSIPIVGVTGSVGKTTTKEMIACVLSRRFKTLKTEKNLNNELGVPLTLFRLGPEHEAAVIELGISHFGDMTHLAGMARPTMAVYTVIGRAHLEFLGDREGVLRAKGELLDLMTDDGAVFVNGDDDLLAGLSCRRKTITFGLGGICDVRAESLYDYGGGKTACEIAVGKRRIPVSIPAFGRHMVYAALAAAAVGLRLGLTDEEITAGIADYVPVGRRADVVETPYLTIIDDCYNANPDSAASAIESAAELGGRLVCILGDMLELGENSETLHKQTGDLALAAGAVLLTAGELSRCMGGRHFTDKQALIAALPSILKKGDIVLVKASHSQAFEEISEALKSMVL